MTRRPDEPRFANLRSGDMAQIPDDTPCGIGWGRLTAWGAAFVIVGLVAGYASVKVPEYYEAPRGYGACIVKGC